LFLLLTIFRTTVPQPKRTQSELHHVKTSNVNIYRLSICLSHISTTMLFALMTGGERRKVDFTASHGANSSSLSCRMLALEIGSHYPLPTFFRSSIMFIRLRVLTKLISHLFVRLIIFAQI
jgi:hypothetical protein